MPRNLSGSLVWEDNRHDDQEQRYWAIGYIGDQLHYLAYTYRGERVRVISLRYATRKERRLYER